MKRLVQQAQNGDADAFVQLIEGNRQNIYTVPLSYVNNPDDAADVIQDTILTAFERIQDVKEPVYFKTWMTRILINKCKDFLDKRNREVVYDEMPEKAYSDNMLEHMEYEELIRAVDTQYRDILILHYVEGFKTKEIAEVLGMKDATVRTRLRRGRENLAQVLAKRKEAGLKEKLSDSIFQERMGKYYA